MISLALTGLVVGVFKAYQSAYGSPAALVEIPEQPISTLARRLDKVRDAAANAAMRGLATAVVSTVLAVALLAAVSVLTWFAPSEPSPDKSVCLTFENKLVAKIPGDNVSVSTLATGAAVSPC
ncbi:hypothetical protein AB0P21_20540 [Kribbella sp. NPDC056861]|uniref:hypothetical protein n=1 Tax=Kribbella sp. NPDC056861 TaxID=3154857 RepID=UPI00343A67C7